MKLSEFFKPSPYPGLFVVFEGIDCSGKTTQTKKLRVFLKDCLISNQGIISVSEPSNGPITRQIRNILAKSEVPDHYELQRLFIMDSNEQMKKIIIPRLQKGGMVICDRYRYSGLAYGLSAELSLETLMGLHEDIIGENLILPDIVFYMRISAEEALRRKEKRKGSQEYFETESRLRTITTYYQKIFGSFPWNVRVIDADQSREKVYEAVKTITASIMDRRF